MTKAVFFDWFNTLADYHPPREEVQAKACRELGIEVDKEKLSPGILLADHYYIEENLRSPIKQRSSQEQFDIYTEMQRVVMREVGVNPSDKLALSIVQEVGKLFADRSFALFEDVPAALDLLKQRELILGIISNIEVDLVPVCQGLGIGPFLNVIVTSEEVGSGKPYAPIYLAALERAGVEASESIYVGDHYGTDVLGAEQVGMQGVLLDRCNLFHQITDCPRISTLTDLLDYV